MPIEKGMNIPCKMCIAFAMCNANEVRISCPFLYRYFIEGGIKNEYKDGSDFYTSPQTDRLDEIITIFNKPLKTWSLSTDKPFFDGDKQPEMEVCWNTSK